MLQGRRLCRISLLIILVIALSAYSPWDFLGIYAQANYVNEYLVDGSPIVAVGQISHKEIKNDKVIYYVNNSFISNSTCQMSDVSFLFRFDSDSIPLNSKVKINGSIKRFSVPRNEGEFDLREYYQSLGLLFEIDEPTVDVLQVNNISIGEKLYRLSNELSEIYSKSLPAEESGFLSSLTIGNKSQLDNSLKDLFKKVGVAHILAVSGLHISVVCMALYRFLRRGGVSFKMAAITSSIISVLYGILTGGSLSSIRAIGMFLVFLLGDVLGESYDTLTALGLMAVALLVYNPLFIKNGSFIFSFGAIIGIVFIASPLAKGYSQACINRNNRLKTKEGFSYDKKLPIYIRLKDWLITSLLFSFGINIAMLPIVTNMYYETPLYSLAVNLVVLPFMPMLLILGIFGGSLGLIYFPLGRLFLMPCHYIIYGMEMFSSAISDLPFSRIIVGKKSLALVMAYYAVLFLLMKFIKRRRLLYLSLLFISILWVIPHSKAFEMDFLDVGQGDGIYISSGDGTNFFIDGGSTSKDKIGEYTILPFLKSKGVNKIDYWFLSHLDEDHISGLIEVLETGYEVDNIILSYAMPLDETHLRIKELANINDSNILYMKKGDICGTPKLHFKCVFPWDGIKSDDMNELCLSLLMELDEDLDGAPDYKAFFGGDIGCEQEQMLAESGLISHVDLLKVSHHGSRFSSDPDFLEVLSPDLAIISCAKKNRYGHPADEAISRLHDSGAYIMYTMNSGQIHVENGKVFEFIKRE